MSAVEKQSRSNRICPRLQRRRRVLMLAAMLCSLAPLTVIPGIRLNDSLKQRQIVSKIETLGGSVLYYYQTGWNDKLIEDAPLPGPAWLVYLLGVDFFDDVYKVSFPALGSQEGAGDLSFLNGLRAFGCLQISGASDDDLTWLAGMKDLYRLELVDSQFSDLSPLISMQIEKLALVETEVDDLSSLAQMWISELYFIDCQSEDISSLSGMNNLSVLHLQRTHVSDLSPLKEMTTLVELSLAGSPVDDIAALAEIRKLTRLDLSDTNVSDATVLMSLDELRELDLSGTKINKEEADELLSIHNQGWPFIELKWEVRSR